MGKILGPLIATGAKSRIQIRIRNFSGRDPQPLICMKMLRFGTLIYALSLRGALTPFSRSQFFLRKKMNAFRTELSL
jgi:hypothetical protein